MMAEVLERPVREVSPEEAAEIFDRHAQRLLGISGAEFVRRYDAGEYNSPVENSAVIQLEIMLPFAENLRNGRQNPY